MPACSKCSMLKNSRCTAHERAMALLNRPIPEPPIGACMIPIVESYLCKIKPGMKVLEVGCGAWNMVKSHCERVGAHYEGIDTREEYFEQKVIATRIENLAELSFESDYFDIVIGTQSMEHWAEFGCSLPWGMYQCFRVCKPGGLVLMNVPIHFHGTKYFLLGQKKKIAALFKPYSNNVQFEDWGNPSEPIPQFHAYTHYWKLKGKAAYILDIQAVKNNMPSKVASNRLGFTGRISQVFNYPMSYNFFRLLRKLRLVPRAS